jgi:hypothetical protein
MYDTPPKVGDKVVVPWWKHVRSLRGTITKIDGAYHYIKVKGNPNYDVLELYETEFMVISK